MWSKFILKILVEESGVWKAESPDHLFEPTDPPGGISAQNPAMRKLKISAIYPWSHPPAKNI
jgi:hypothetical protein